MANSTGCSDTARRQERNGMNANRPRHTKPNGSHLGSHPAYNYPHPPTERYPENLSGFQKISAALRSGRKYFPTPARYDESGEFLASMTATPEYTPSRMDRLCHWWNHRVCRRPEAKAELGQWEGFTFTEDDRLYPGYPPPPPELTGTVGQFDPCRKSPTIADAVKISAAPAVNGRKSCT